MRGSCAPVEQQDIESVRNAICKTNLLLKQILDTLIVIPKRNRRRIKHIPYNPYLYGMGSTGSPFPVELIPEGYVLEKVIHATEYEWIMVVKEG